ncbi:hypothetical protein CCR94_22515 [Rhodoblastus sphagnicola]|uniref:Addiction module toxin RelE n=1 Tax=Rhodoblastus sphagnicola TaxID=333368 RepID=A0A2S6MVL6_9HYPH|nr:type II toxin-antitoxin system YafQ family toxin [Rhodoblastus sphagnicola]PPQ26410.1 hypothetical protein CCR94_22515 [Rhodoblastus sphagnicola]
MKGQWRNYRERHVRGDFLLIYAIDESAKPPLVVFVRAGTPADLFDE